MKIVCRCGNDLEFIELTDEELIKKYNYDDNPDLGREDHINLMPERHYKFDFDAQYEYFYIQCRKCNKKFKITT